MRSVTTLEILLVILVLVGLYTNDRLSIGYEEYREAASEELDRLSTQSMDCQVDLIQLKNQCNQVLGEPFYGDNGNDYSN